MTDSQLQALLKIAACGGLAPSYRLDDLQMNACTKDGLAIRTRYGLQLTSKGRAALAELSSAEPQTA